MDKDKRWDPKTVRGKVEMGLRALGTMLSKDQGAHPPRKQRLSETHPTLQPAGN